MINTDRLIQLLAVFDNTSVSDEESTFLDEWLDLCEWLRPDSKLQEISDVAEL